MVDKNNEEIEGYACSDCGADVTEEDKICPKCGADLTIFEEDNKEKDNYFGHNLELESFQYIQDPSSLTKFLKVMLVVYFTISFISLVSDIMQLDLLNSLSISQAQADENDTRQRVIGISYIAVSVITGIIFLKWIYRANVNCRGFIHNLSPDETGLFRKRIPEFTPGWSIGYYFIPFLNLYKPYKAMREIFAISENPKDWYNIKLTDKTLIYWWALWLISNSLSQLSFRLSLKADTIESLQNSTTISIISETLDLILSVVCINLVSKIFSKQERLVKKIA